MWHKAVNEYVCIFRYKYLWKLMRLAWIGSIVILCCMKGRDSFISIQTQTVHARATGAGPDVLYDPSTLFTSRQCPVSVLQADAVIIQYALSLGLHE